MLIDNSAFGSICLGLGLRVSPLWLQATCERKGGLIPLPLAPQASLLCMQCCGCPASCQLLFYLVASLRRGTALWQQYYQPYHTLLLLLLLLLCWQAANITIELFHIMIVIETCMILGDTPQLIIAGLGSSQQKPTTRTQMPAANMVTSGCVSP